MGLGLPERTGMPGEGEIVSSWSKSIIQWRENERPFFSITFTWHLPEAFKVCQMFFNAGVKPLVGGDAVKLMPDYLKSVAEIGQDADCLYLHNPEATFTTRGCIRNCSFCAVPRIEGEFRELAEWEIKPIICDNNILASSNRHFSKVIDSLKSLKHIDFNQGLDARLLNAFHVSELQKLNLPMIRFSWDYTPTEPDIMAAIERMLKAGFPKSRINIYILIGHGDSPDDALYRFNTIKSLGIRPTPMRYQPLDALTFDSFVDKNWTEAELCKMRRYWFRQNWLSKVPYADFIN